MFRQNFKVLALLVNFICSITGYHSQKNKLYNRAGFYYFEKKLLGQLKSTFLILTGFIVQFKDFFNFDLTFTSVLHSHYFN